jgi:hypothetical protein
LAQDDDGMSAMSQTPADLTIESLQLPSELGQQQMAFGDQFIEVERVKQPALIAHPSSPNSVADTQARNHSSADITSLFQHHRPEADFPETAVQSLLGARQTSSDAC